MFQCCVRSRIFVCSRVKNENLKGGGGVGGCMCVASGMCFLCSLSSQPGSGGPAYRYFSSIAVVVTFANYFWQLQIHCVPQEVSTG